MNKIFLSLLVMLLLTSSSLFAQDEVDEPSYFSATELQLLAAFGPNKLATDDDPGNFIATFDHFSTWSHGSNYFFFDVSGGDDFDPYNEDITYYMEYNPTLSLFKTFGGSGGDGIIRDVSLSGGFNSGRGVGFEIDRVWLEGIAVDWNIPGFAVLSTHVYARQEKRYAASWQATTVWNVPFTISSTNWNFRGFFDVWQRRKDEAGTEDAMVFITQPQLLIALDMFGMKGVKLGVEEQISYNFPAKSAYSGEDNAWDFYTAPMVVFAF